MKTKTTSFLSARDQNALEAILAKGEFVPCENEKREDEISLGFLTDPQKAIYSLREKRMEEQKVLAIQYQKAQSCRIIEAMNGEPVTDEFNLEETKNALWQTNSDVEFLDALLWKGITGSFDATHYAIRQGWEVVTRVPATDEDEDPGEEEPAGEGEDLNEKSNDPDGEESRHAQQQNEDEKAATGKTNGFDEVMDALHKMMHAFVGGGDPFA